MHPRLFDCKTCSGCTTDNLCAVIQCQAQDVTMTERKAVIKNADMSEDLQQDAVDFATQASESIAVGIGAVRQAARHRSSLCYDGPRLA